MKQHLPLSRPHSAPDKEPSPPVVVESRPSQPTAPRPLQRGAATGWALLRVVCVLGLICLLLALVACGTADHRTMVAMATAASQTMDSADKKAVLIAALDEAAGPDGKPARRWPFLMLGGDMQLGMPVVDAKGNLVAMVGQDGRVQPVYGGLRMNFERSFTDANRTVNSVVSIYSLAKASVAESAAKETASKEATKQAANDNATKAAMGAEANRHAEALKGMELEAAVPAP